MWWRGVGAEVLELLNGGVVGGEVLLELEVPVGLRDPHQGVHQLTQDVVDLVVDVVDGGVGGEADGPEGRGCGRTAPPA